MVDVSAGSASVNGSEVYCWGSVAGSGTPKSMNFPSGPNYVRATTGAMHACANFPNTAMMCIGLNNFGQFGDGTTKDSNVPIWAGVPLGFAEAIGTGFDHACAISKNGAVQCWGDDTYGQLGDGVSAAPGP